MSAEFAPSQSGLPDASWSELLRWLLQRRHRFRVTGNSMLPLLRPGDLVLVNRHAYSHKSPQPGDVVVARDPRQPSFKLIKRVDAVMQDGRCFLLSENPAEGTDSRTFGAVPPDHVLGQVTCYIRTK
ncbi:MAG: nickel-type superoxide dismutase maturation protease [Caldilineaceae bacterium]